jgi:hypothetical protein
MSGSALVKAGGFSGGERIGGWVSVVFFRVAGKP